MLEIGSGHFCITLVSENLLTHMDDVDEREKKVCDVLVAMESIEVSDLKKLNHYRQTHPDKLLKFLKNAGKCTDGLRSALVVRSKQKKPHLSVLFLGQMVQTKFYPLIVGLQSMPRTASKKYWVVTFPFAYC